MGRFGCGVVSVAGSNHDNHVPSLGTDSEGVERFGVHQRFLDKQSYRRIRWIYNRKSKVELCASMIPHYRVGEMDGMLFGVPDTNRSQMHEITQNECGQTIERVMRPCELGLLYRGSLRRLLAQYKHPKFRDNPEWRARLREDIVNTIRLRGSVTLVRAETDVDYDRDLFDYPRNKAARIRWTPRSHWFRKHRDRLTDTNLVWHGEDND